MYALATHQLQMERREDIERIQVDALATPQLKVGRVERDIEPIKVDALATHQPYR